MGKGKTLTSIIAMVGGIIGLADATKVSGAPIASFSEIAPRAAESRNYITHNLTYMGQTPAYKIVLFAYKDFEGVGRRAVGGLDNDYPEAKNEAGGYVNKDDQYNYGLNEGEIIPGFIGGIDSDFSGKIEAFDSSGAYDPNHPEYIPPEYISFSGCPPFELGSGSLVIDNINIIPEPVTLSLLALSGAAVAGRKRQRR